MECYQYVVLVVVMACVLFQAISGIPVRLVQSSVPNAGRVEVQYKGIWGSICDDYWNLQDAHVICRQLNFTRGALMAPCCVPFGYNMTSRIWLDDVDCHGNETDISQCGHRPWGVHDCHYKSQASVVCVPDNYTDDYKFRLNGDLVPYAGRVEVLHAGVWGDIDNIGWDINDGHVICRSLGYARAVTVVYRAQLVFKDLKSIVKWWKHVDCLGNETSLSECPFVVETERSTYGFDAGIVCESNNGTNTTDLTFRLKTNVSHAGRVEVLFAGKWGVVNSHQWDMTSAHVICRQLGYAGAEMAIHGASHVLKLPPRSIEWIRDVHCDGSESSLVQCHHTILFDNDGSQDAGVVCSTNQTEIRFRLAGGSNSYGRVETYYAGVWGTVNNAGFDMKAATVVCNHLEFSGTPSVIKFAVGPFGPGTGVVWLTDLSCYGNETSLWECRHSKLFRNYWSHDYDAGVVCDTPIIDSFKVRLSQSNYGRVELLYLGVWGTVSGTNFSKGAADVICRQLGFPSSLASFDYGAFGPGEGPVWLSGLKCTGNESNIGSCLMDGFSAVYPTHFKDAGLVCKKNGVSYQDYSVRLLGGSSYYGRVEVQFKGVWGSIVHVLGEDQSRVGSVICRQLGFTGINKTVSNAATIYGSGTGPVWMTHVSCHGNETSIDECTFDRDFHGRYPEFGVICNRTRLPVVTTTSPTLLSTTAKSDHSTPAPSLLSSIIMIGVPVVAGVAGLVVVLVCVVKLWRHNHRKYTTGNEFVRMDESARGIERRDLHSFRNVAMEMEDERRDWLEIPRSSVTQVEEIRSEKNVTIHRGQVETDGGIVKTCLVKSIQGPDDSACNSNELLTVYRLAKHPNILHFIGACSLNNPLLLIFEFPESGNMLQYLRKHQTSSDANENNTGTQATSCNLPRVERLRLALEIATGMKWLAQQNVVHGCLSAKSVYLGKNGAAKIGNIGASRDRETTKNDHRWMSPESIESSTFSSKSDAWSYGVLLWELETGGLVPYSEFDEAEIYPKIKSGYKLPRPAKCTDVINSLIKECLRTKPDQRPDFHNICDRLDAIIAEDTAC